MSSSIRLTNSGVPDTPPSGYARLFLQDFEGILHLKMIRPDGTIQVFGTLNQVLGIDRGGTGTDVIPGVGQFLIGTGDGYRVGDIVAGPGVSIVKTESTFEISTDISNIELQMPSEFNVVEDTSTGQNVFVVSKAHQAKNSVYAGPATEDGTPVFRFLQIEDIPELPIEKITNLIETIRAESLLVPTDSDDIDHTYDNVTKVLTSAIKPTGVTTGSYGSATAIPAYTVKPDGRLELATDIDIAIPSTQVTDFIEASQDVVGQLSVNSDSINAEYNDFENTLKFHVNEEYLITTNISDTEVTRAPTSQSIKTYVDNLLEAERDFRIADDNEIRTKIDTFLENAPGVLDTIVEISQRFDAVEDAIRDGAIAQTQAAADETARVNGELDRIYNSINAHREIFNLTPEMVTQEIELEAFYLDTIMPNSVVAFIDRIGIFEDLDFVLADGPNDKVVLTFTQEALNILDGTEVLRITYLTKT